MSQPPAQAGRKRAVPLKVWALLALLFGGVVGLGMYTFAYAEGTSYLSDDPAACRNCHIMNDVYDAWERGPHHAVATCNDCHIPHVFPDKYVVKALNGVIWIGSWKFCSVNAALWLKPLSALTTYLSGNTCGMWQSLHVATA